LACNSTGGKLRHCFQTPATSRVRRRSPVVYTRSDCRDDRRDSRLVYALQAIAPTVAATIAPTRVYALAISIVVEAILME